MRVPGRFTAEQSIPGRSASGRSIPGRSESGRSIPGRSIPGRSIRALIVEDSAATSAALARVLQHDGDIAVMGQTASGAAAIDLITQHRPDVVILDLGLADGSGQHLVEQIMARTPTPILVLSVGSGDGRSPTEAAALIAGALAALPIPQSWTAELENQLRRCVRQIHKVTVIRHPRGRSTTSNRPPNQPAPNGGRQPVVALAASTGGPSALAIVLAGLAGLSAPVLVVQHLHPDFTNGLLEWMSRASALPVAIALHDQLAEPGHVYLAPGGVHLRLAGQSRLELSATPATVHRPSANQLFLSVAEHSGAAGVGVIMTGMGEDGAPGLLEMHRRGGRTIGQDEASCAVFGMPRAAQRLGAVDDLLPLDQLAGAIVRAVAAVGT